MDLILFGTEAPPAVSADEWRALRRNVTWDDRIRLLRELCGSATLRGQTAFVRVARSYLHEVDHFALRDMTKPYVEDAIWTRIDRKGQPDAVAGVLAGKLAARPRSRSALAAIAKQGPGAPRVGLLLEVELPKVTDEFRQNEVRMLLGEKVARDRKQAEDAAEAIAHALSAGKPALFTEREVEQVLIQFTHAAPVMFEYCLDALKARAGVDMASLFSTWAKSENYGRRERLAVLVRRLPQYAADPVVTRFLAAHRAQTARARRHTFDVKARQIRLEQGRGVVRLHGDHPRHSVVDDVWPGYHRDDPIERIKPERMQALCGAWMHATATAMDGLVADPREDDAGPTTEKLVGDAFSTALETLSPPLSEADVQKGELRISLRVYAIRVADAGASAERFEIKSALVERFGTDAWRELEQPRWRSEEDFTEELDWFRFSEMMDATEFVIDVIAGVTIGAVSIGVLWAGGAGAALVNLARGAGSALLRLAGGKWVLAANVGISVVIDFVMKAVRHESYDLGDFVGAAFDGYLNAVGFRLFKPIGALAGRLTPTFLRNRITSWLIPMLVREGLAGAATAPVSLFARDLVRIQRDGGKLSGWRDYLRSAGWGGAFGILGEIGGSAVMKGLAGAFKLVKRGVGAMTPEAVVEALRKQGVDAQTWTAEATVSLSRYDRALAEVLTDPAARANATAAMREQIEAVTRLTRGNLSPSVHQHALELASADLSRGSVQGIERLLANKARLAEPQVDGFLRALVAKPAAADNLLTLLGAADATTFTKLHTPDELARLVASDAIPAAIERGSAGDIAFVLTHECKGSVERLDEWARQLGRLEPKVQDAVIDVIRAHGARLRPTAILATARAGIDFTPELRVGLERLADLAGADSVNALLVRTPPRLAELAAAAGKAGEADLAALKSILDDTDRAVQLLSEPGTIDEIIAAERRALTPPTGPAPPDVIAQHKADIEAVNAEIAELQRKRAAAEAGTRDRLKELRQNERKLDVEAKAAERRSAAKPGDADLRKQAAEARRKHEDAEWQRSEVENQPAAVESAIAEARQRLADAQARLERALAPPSRPPTPPSQAVLRQRVDAFRRRFPKVDGSPSSIVALTDLFSKAGTTGSTYLPVHTRPAAAELKTIVELSTRADVVRIEAIPHAAGSRSPDFVIDVRAKDGSIKRSRVEVTTVTGANAGHQPVGSAAKDGTTPGEIADAVRGKLRSTDVVASQLDVQMPGVPPGGTLAVHLPYAAQRGTADVAGQIDRAVRLVNASLEKGPAGGGTYVPGVDLAFHVPGQEPVRYVRGPDGAYAPAAAAARAGPGSDAEDEPPRVPGTGTAPPAPAPPMPPPTPAPAPAPGPALKGLLRRLWVVDAGAWPGLPAVVRSEALKELEAIFAFVGKTSGQRPFTVQAKPPTDLPQTLDFSESIVSVVRDQVPKVYVDDAMKLQEQNIDDFLTAQHVTRPRAARTSRTPSSPEKLGRGGHDKRVLDIGATHFALGVMAGVVSCDELVKTLLTDWADDAVQKRLKGKALDTWSPPQQTMLGQALGRGIAHEARHEYVGAGHADAGLGSSAPDLWGEKTGERFSNDDQLAILKAVQALEKAQGTAALVPTFPSAVRADPQTFPF